MTEELRPSIRRKTEDSRVIRRIPSTTKLAFRVLKLEKQVETSNLKTIEVNGGGVFIVSEYLPSPQSLVELQLTVPGKSKPLNVIAKVLYIQEEAPNKGFAVEFFRIQERDREALMRVAKRGSWQTPLQPGD